MVSRSFSQRAWAQFPLTAKIHPAEVPFSKIWNSYQLQGCSSEEMQFRPTLALHGKEVAGVKTYETETSKICMVVHINRIWLNSQGATLANHIRTTCNPGS